MSEPISEIEQRQSIEAFQSAIRKSENALKNMVEKGANTSVLEKRLHAFYVGLHVLEHSWHNSTGQPNITEKQYSQIDFTAARQVMHDLLPSLKGMKAKAKEGSPQHTLLERRIRAFQQAIGAMDIELQ